MMNSAQLARFRTTLVASLLLLLVVFVISVATGDISLSPAQLGKIILGQGSHRENLILFEFRLPRIFVTLLAGVGLAISGAILQSITRNPLADPGIIGINAGAGMMVVIYIATFTLETSSFVYILPLFALLGGVLTAAIIYLFSYKKEEGIDPTRMVLVGVGMAAAISGSMLIVSNHFDRNQYAFIAKWLAGSIWGNDWTFVLSLLPWILILVPLVFAKSNVLNVLNLSENVSVNLGVNMGKERFQLILIAVALASASVAVSGSIAFVGLMAPHIARSLVGPRHQAFLPISAVLGGLLLLAADTIGRVVLDASGIPAGIIVMILGAPYFMYLLARK